MLGDGAQTPSRSELLCMVKKNSKMLGKTIVEDETSDVETDPLFWHGVMDVYFIRGRESRGRQEDDLVFFAKKLHLQKHGSNEDESANSPYFVRRWGPKLDDLIGASASDVDWRRSFYLNLIAQTSFSVTVAICSQQVLQNYQTGKDRPLSPIYKVVKTVYASPSRINFHLDSRKEVETTSAYPEICFAVDDYDSTFDAVITLFSGFVSYQMVRDAYDAGRSGFGSLLSLHSVGKTDRIYMKGPGGRGEVEVAVSGVVDQSKQDLSQNSVDHDSKKGLSFSAVVRRAASVASEAAKHAYAAASATRDEGMIPLKCCLMSISLPWEHIAHDLLFKGSPPVNL
ncbi:uncharacterized protein LOC129902363 isoform X4 [Solanum dulcamara]|uniref:uncharacterized protein LOC129902363 isoform X4 n=1 Tax=Solanum dulcamara TaxID=45834 RepID=UPI0024869616|nr:uncharacterized protein LOC129902363 isoform X4 [Solanum dulcamara]